MTDASYSKPETDSKLALVEERVDHKFDRMLAEVKEGFVALNNRFTQEIQDVRGEINDVQTEIHQTQQALTHEIKLIDKELSWVKWVSIASAGLILTAAAKYLFH